MYFDACIQDDYIPFSYGQGKARSYFKQDLVVAQLNVSFQYFHLIFHKRVETRDARFVFPNIMGCLGPFRMLPIGYTTHVK